MRFPTNADKTITMHDIPGLPREPIRNGASIANIQAGFRSTGICQLNVNIFIDVGFLPSEITNRPPINVLRPITPEIVDEMPNHVPANIEIEQFDVDLDRSIEQVQPFPKAGPRKPTNRGRKKREMTILEDSEEMEKWRAEEQAKVTKKAEVAAAKIARAEKKVARESEKQAKAAEKAKKKAKKKAKASKGSCSGINRGRGHDEFENTND